MQDIFQDLGIRGLGQALQEENYESLGSHQDDVPVFEDAVNVVC